MPNEKASRYLLLPIALIGGALAWVAGSYYFDTGFSWHWPARSPIGALTILALAPFAEEWVFRGVLWAYLTRRLVDQGQGDRPLKLLQVNLLSTTMFCFYHWLWVDWTQAILVAVPSLYLGYLRVNGYGLRYCIIVHSVWNYGWIAILPGTSPI